MEENSDWKTPSPVKSGKRAHLLLHISLLIQLRLSGKTHANKWSEHKQQWCQGARMPNDANANTATPNNASIAPVVVDVTTVRGGC